MLEFMDYITEVFYRTTDWNTDNAYKTVSATSNDILNFPLPKSLQISLSSLSSPNFANSLSFNAFGAVQGHISYLYTSRALQNVVTSSAQIDLANLVRGYRDPSPLKRPDDPAWWQVWQRGKRIDKRDTLLLGRLKLPTSTLEALYLRRISPTRLLELRAVSDASLRNGGTIIAFLKTDESKYSTEYLFSTDGCLVGISGLYNFGPDPRKNRADGSDPSSARNISNNNALLTKPPSRFSVGAEFLYGLANKAAGLSTGFRFSTLPPYSVQVPPQGQGQPQSQSQSSPSPSLPANHSTFPYTMTLTLNPLVGSLCTTYSVKAGELLSLASQFDFNFYSYQSDVILGAEIWRRHRDTLSSVSEPEDEKVSERDGLSAQHGVVPSSAGIRISGPAALSESESLTDNNLQLNGSAPPFSEPNIDPDSIASVIKARIDQDFQVRVLYEKRYKHILISIGATIDLRAPFTPSETSDPTIQSRLDGTEPSSPLLSPVVGAVPSFKQNHTMASEGQHSSGGRQHNPKPEWKDSSDASSTGMDRQGSSSHGRQIILPSSSSSSRNQIRTVSGATVSSSTSSGSLPKSPALGVETGPTSKPVGSFVSGIGVHVTFSS